jgi:AcrR family transcriptional regulator
LEEAAAGQRVQQSRARATREALVRAAAEQFAVAGYQAASLRRLAADAGVSKGAVYFHFSDKRAVADAVIDATTDLWRRMIEDVDALGLDPLTTVVAQGRRVAELMIADPVAHGGTRLLNDPSVASDRAEAHYALAESAVGSRLAAADAAGLLRRPVDTGVLARSIVATVVGNNLMCERRGVLDQLPARIEEMWRDLLPRIATDSWLREHTPGVS